MRSPLGSFVWFAIIAIAVAYASSTFAGSISFAQARGDFEPVLIRDSLGPDTHHLSGMIEVPSSCDQLQSNVVQDSSTRIRIEFSTWQDPSTTCDGERTPRAFQETVFAPAVGVDFVATLDGQSLPISVVPVIVQK